MKKKQTHYGLMNLQAKWEDFLFTYIAYLKINGHEKDATYVKKLLSTPMLEVIKEI